MSSRKLNESAMLHIKNLLNMVPGISAQKVKNSLESQGFKNVPCRQTIYTIIKEMNVDEVSVESEINNNYQEISAYRFDFMSIGANDIGHIIINLETQRSQNTGCFLKFNKNESNLFALKGRRYVLNSTKRNLSEFICTSCRHLYTNDIKNKDLNCNTSKKDCVSTFLADGTFSLENMQITKHHKNCSDIFFLPILIDQFKMIMSKKVSSGLIMLGDSYMIMLNLAAKFAISNNLNPLSITSDVYFPSKQLYIKNLESKSLIKSFDISDIPLDLKTTVYGSNFVRIVDEKYIILVSGPALVEAGKSSIWVMDGTFKCVAKNYFQLYTISTKSEIDGKGRAAIFGLLMNKKTDTYKKFFQDVRNECFKECQLHNIDPLFSQKTIVCDKEVAAYDTAMKIFDCKIQLCYFHTITNIQKKLRSVGLGLCYQRKVEGYDLRSNYELRYAKDLYRLIKHCYTLFFFPLDKCLLFYSVHIEPEILRIANLWREKKNSILKFKNYLLKEWLTDGKKFKVSQSLVFKQTVRTTNIAESFHSVINRSALVKKRGKLGALIKSLKDIDFCNISDITRISKISGAILMDEKNVKLMELFNNYTFSGSESLLEYSNIVLEIIYNV